MKTTLIKNGYDINNKNNDDIRTLYGKYMKWVRSNRTD